jgi:segregation and condensation protein A
LSENTTAGGNGPEARVETYRTELDGIRAPLGVILYLIRRDNLDIYDIPIAKITREYLDYLNTMEEARIELAGEFFVLAATLMRIKAQMLLRRDDEEGDDPREDLVRSLLEYKKMVEAANTFKDLEEDRARIFTRPVPSAEKEYREEPQLDLSLYQLMRAFQEVMYHFNAAEVREIELEEYTIEEKIEAVTGALEANSQVLFADLFEGAASRMELIVTLMAVLELIKHGHACVRQEQPFSSIWLYRGPNFGQSLDSVDDWFGQQEESPEGAAPEQGAEENTDSAGQPTGGPSSTLEEEANPDDNGQPRPR